MGIILAVVAAKADVAAVQDLRIDLALYDDVLCIQITLVDLKIDAAFLCNGGGVQNEVGFHNGFEVSVAAVGAGLERIALNRDGNVRTAVGSDHHGIAGQVDVAAVRGNDRELVGDHVGVVGIAVVVAVVVVAVGIVEDGVFAAKDDAHFLAADGFVHFHLGGVIHFFDLRLFRRLQNAGLAIGSIPGSVGKQHDGVAAGLQNVEVNLAGVILNRSQVSILEDALYGVVGIAEAQMAFHIVAAFAVVHVGMDVAGNKLHKRTVFAIHEVVAVEVQALGAVGPAELYTLRRHVDAGGNFMHAELGAVGKNAFLLVGLAVDLVRRAQIAALLIEAIGVIGGTEGDDLAFVGHIQRIASVRVLNVHGLLQIEDGTHGDVRLVALEHHASVLVDDAQLALLTEETVLLGGKPHTDGSFAGVEGHIGGAHVGGVIGNQSHGAHGVLVIGLEDISVLVNDLHKSFVVLHELVVGLAVGEAIALSVHIDVLAAAHGLFLAARRKDRGAARLILQLRLIEVDAAVAVVLNAYRLDGLLPLCIQAVQNILVRLVMAVAVEGMIAVGILVLILIKRVHGITEGVGGLDHDGAVGQRSVVEALVGAAVRLSGVLHVDKIGIAILEGNSLTGGVEDTLAGVDIVHEEIAARDLLIAAVEIRTGNLVGANHGEFDNGDLIVAVFVLRCQEVLVGQLLVTVIVPLHVPAAVVLLLCTVGANGCIVDNRIGKAAVFDADDRAASVNRDAAGLIGVEGIGIAFLELKDVLAGQRISAECRGACRRAGNRHIGQFTCYGFGALCALRHSLNGHGDGRLGNILDGFRGHGDRNGPVAGQDLLDFARDLISQRLSRAGDTVPLKAQNIRCRGRSRLGRLAGIGAGGADILALDPVEIAFHKAVAVMAVAYQLHHVVDSPAVLDVLQNIEIILPMAGLHLGRFAGGRFGMVESVLEIDVGAIGQGPDQRTFLTAQVYRTAGGADGDGVVLQIDDLGDLIAALIGDLLNLAIVQGKGHIAEVVVDALTVLGAPDIAAGVNVEHPVVGHEVIIAAMLVTVDQELLHVQVGILVLVLEIAIGGQNVVRSLTGDIQNRSIHLHTAGIHQIVVGAGLGNEAIRVHLEVADDLAGGIDGDVQLAVGRGHTAKIQRGIRHFHNVVIGLSGFNQHMLEVGENVALRVHGYVGVPLGLIHKTVVVDGCHFGDQGLEAVIRSSADGVGTGNGKAVGPETDLVGAAARRVQRTLGDGTEVIGMLFVVAEGVHIHVNVDAAAGDVHILIGIVHHAGEIHIAALVGIDAELGQFIDAGGLQRRQGVDLKVGLFHLAVDHGDLAQSQITAAAVADDQIGQIAVIVDGGRAVDAVTEQVAAGIASGNEGAAIVVVEMVQRNAVGGDGSNAADGVIEAGGMDRAVFIDLHEDAGCAAAQMEAAVQINLASGGEIVAGIGPGTAVIGLTEGKDLDKPVGGRVRLGLGGAGDDLGVLQIGGLGVDAYPLTGHIRLAADIDSNVGTDLGYGLSHGLAAAARNVSGGAGVVIQLRGNRLDQQLVDAAQEDILQVHLLAVVGNDLCKGFCHGNSGDGLALGVGQQTLLQLRENAGLSAVDVGLLVGIAGIAAQIHMRLCRYLYGGAALVVAADTAQIADRAGVGRGAVQRVELQRAEEGRDLGAFLHGDGGGAVLSNVGVGSFAGEDKTAAIHVQIRLQRGLAALAAEEVHAAVAGHQPGQSADGDLLSSIPVEVDAGLAVFAQRDIGGIDVGIEIHVGVGLDVHIVSGLNVRVVPHRDDALLGDVHADAVFAAGNGAHVGAVESGVALHLVPGFHVQIAVGEDLAVYEGPGRLGADRIDELITTDSGKVHIGALTVAAGFQLGVAAGVDVHIAGADGADLRAAAHARLGAVAADFGFRADHGGVGKVDAGTGNLGLGNDPVGVRAAAGVARGGPDGNAARLDCGAAFHGGSGAHAADLGQGLHHVQRSHTNGHAGRLGRRPDGVLLGLGQKLDPAGGIDDHIAIDGDGVAHAAVGLGDLRVRRSQRSGHAAVAAQNGLGGAIVHQGLDADVAGGVDAAVAAQIGVLIHAQIRLGIVDGDACTPHLDLSAGHSGFGLAAAAVHQHLDAAGVQLAAALDAAAGGGIGGGVGRV